MGDQTSSLDMFQEARAQPGSFVGTLDQARHVSHNEDAPGTRRAAGIGGNNAQMRLEGRERIRRDFRSCRGNARNQGGLASVGEANERDVRQQLEFEPQVAFFAWSAVFMLARRLVPRANKGGIPIAAPPPPTAGCAKSLAVFCEIEELLP